MSYVMKWVLTCMLLASSAHAEQRIIVRALAGQLTINSACVLLGCSVVRGLGDPLSQVFLVTIPDLVNLNVFIGRLGLVSGIVNVEPDMIAKVLEARPTIPGGLYDPEQVTFYGARVRRAYTEQPAAEIVRLTDVRNRPSVAGGATIAVIDTGVDPNHPALRSILLSGYDFTRGDQESASEIGDVTQSTAAVVDGVPPTYVNNSAAAVVDQSTAAVVDDPDHAAFGHGTMVAGVIHLVAPQSKILPLKAFGPDGSGYTSDILRAIYRAARNGARVINMSFSMRSPSAELERAVNHASSGGAVCVASAGNMGQQIAAYPAAWSNVISVASTTNDDRRSTFSNYGSDFVWVAAPGEGVITTYPFGTYAAAWGTSFSTPFVSGTIALLMNIQRDLDPSQAKSAVAQAVPLGSELGHGRLDIVRALNWSRTIH